MEEDKDLEKKIEEAVDIFEQASMQTMNILNVEQTNLTIQNVAKPTIPIKRKTWKELKIGMDNEHAERFNNILTELPDREFVRVYLKALEFVKPKIIRTTGERNTKGDTTINIQINRGNEKTN